MIGTNLCVWINVLITETKHEVLHHSKVHGEKIDDNHLINEHDTYLLNKSLDTQITHSYEDLPKPEHLVSHVLQGGDLKMSSSCIFS